MIDYTEIIRKTEDLIKKRILDLGLVKTGKLLNSITVKQSNDTLFVSAEDYYVTLDEEFDITNYVLNSNELTVFIEKNIREQIEKQI
jgi:hypothetical protein